MSWSPEYVGGCEAAKIAPLIVPYVQGKCLDIGSGPGKAWPRMTGIDTANDRGRPCTDLMMDGTDLSMFGDKSMDAVFSSFMLQQVDFAKVGATLREWARVIKIGGHLVLYLPDSETIEEHERGAEYLEAIQKWRVTRGEVLSTLEAESGCGWTIIFSEKRSATNEYGFLIVARKEVAGVFEYDLWQEEPDGKKRALVIRYGAIGDAIVAASILPGLKAQGYHITINCKQSTKDVLLHDPHVDEFFVQDTDYVPNELLGPYWDCLAQRYHRVVNLSESVEGLFLTLPGRLNHAYSDEARRAIYSKQNYLEHTHNIAAVPHDFNARFYPTPAEMEKAKWDRRKLNGPAIVWCVNGSSPHKVWPWIHTVVGWLLDRTPAHVVLYADGSEIGVGLSNGIFDCLRQDGKDIKRVRAIAGEWELRRSLTFAHVVDCVVGPETGPMNAVGMADVAKVIYLSHSTAGNLTKHWVNTTALVPDVSKSPCYPCHRLHSGWEHCHQDEATSAALCAASISPERVFEAIALKIGAVKVAA